MAHAAIEVLTGWSAADKRRLLEAVRKALCVSLQVPDDDPAVQITEHEPHSMIVPPRHSNRYTMVVVTMFKGRTEATKRKLYASLADELGQVGVPSGDVQVIVHEPPVGNWSLNGIPATDADLGFNINI
jgi:phenylpyruvate tautomerase PptA (4-oxalocrotonate tautomerase family)